MEAKEKYRVLIVENLAAVVSRLERLLGLMDNVHLIAVVDTAESAKGTIRETRPDVVLIDVNLPDANGIQFAEDTRRGSPEIGVVMMAKEKSSESVLQAMRVGANDYLTHEMQLEELRLAIQRTGDIAIAEKNRLGIMRGIDGTRSAGYSYLGDSSTGKVIAVYSPKGGTGVTTIAINMALMMIDASSSVMLVDGSLQFGDVGILLNEISTFSIVDLVTRMYELDEKLVQDVTILHQSSGMRVLTAPPQPELADKITGNNLTVVLEHMRHIYDYIIVNTSSYITDPCLAALDSADLVVVVLTQDISAIRGIISFMNLWKKIGMESSRLLFVLNQYKGKGSISKEKLEQRLNHPISAVIPFDPEIVNRSLTLGIPFATEQPKHPLSVAVKSLAELARKRVKESSRERNRMFAIDWVR